MGQDKIKLAVNALDEETVVPRRFFLDSIFEVVKAFLISNS